MATVDGDWSEMKRLVLTRMDEHRGKLEELDDKVSSINTRLAILADREEREMVLAKSTSMKTAGVIGTVVSAIVAGLIGAFGSGD
jgi:hypothetical protein